MACNQVRPERREGLPFVSSMNGSSSSHATTLTMAMTKTPVNETKGAKKSSLITSQHCSATAAL